MGNRGQKRTETADELPADKRACSSLEFRPSSSNSSSIQTHLNSPNSTPDADMETSSSASASSRSDGEHEKEEDSAYGSCDSDAEQQPRHRMLRDYQRQRSTGDHGKLNNILSNLSEDGNGASGQLAALTELCEVLSFCNEDSLSSLMADSLSPILVKLARNESTADIMLLAIRGITYLCDVFPRSSGFLVRHDAVPALCQRLLAIEYVDVAEQCLQALEKISRDQPLACLQAGAIMAVLNFIDFFSISVQRVALSTVVNICKKLPSEGPAPFVEAVPKLCDLLQHEDQQLVESVATCLIKIADRFCQSSEMLEELCKHELINQVTHLINLNSRITISQPIYNGLIGLLVKLASGSFVAFRSLYELNISSTLKDVLSTYDLSHGMSSSHLVDGNCNQVLEVLKLLNELLPTSAGDHISQLVSDKESFLADHPDFLHKFGMDILPMLVQVVNSGANIYVCHGCLSVISKLVRLSKSDMLVELLKTANIASFLAGVFTRKDHHLLMLALQITDIILQKLSDVFLNSFIKEGVFFAIDTLIMPEKCSQVMFSGIQPSFDSSKSSSAREVHRCLCYAFDKMPSSSLPPCKVDKDSVCNLASHIKTNYFAPELFDSEKGVTDILQNLRTFSAALSDLINMPHADNSPAQQEEKFYSILHQIMLKLNGREAVSTFEFIESGIVKSLMHYLSNGLYLRDNVKSNDIYDRLLVLGRRFEVFAKLFLSYSDIPVEDLPLSVLIRKLQSALSSLENFPVFPSHGFKQRNSYATVPNGRCVTYPCFRVRFVREEGETCLSDFSEDLLTVDPFSTSDAIEGYLLPKIFSKRTENGESNAKALEQMESQPVHLISNANSSQGESSGFIDSMTVDLELAEMQEDDANMSQFASEQVHIRESNSGETMSLDEANVGSDVKEQKFPTESTEKTEPQCSASVDNDDGDSSPRLLLYLEGHQLDRNLTLYQAILQQLLSSENEVIMWAKLWSRVYTVTYRKAVESKQDSAQEHTFLEQKSLISDKIVTSMQNMALFSSLFASKLASDLDKSSPTYDILFLLKSLEGINKYSFHLMLYERIRAFAEGRIDNLDNLKVMVHSVPQNEFVSSRLTEKLEQQMRDSFTLSTGGMPSWCNQLIASCPFLFSFEARCKYFRLVAFGPRRVQLHTSRSSSGASHERQPTAGGLPRKKFVVWRDRILDSATRMMEIHARHKGLLEVEYNEEVGTGLGPTLEFYTLVSHEFQKPGLGMWREDHSLFITSKALPVVDSGILINPFGLFPRPWSPTSDSYDGIKFSEVLKKFVLLGQIVAKAIQDGRVLDVPFSKAFYKLILGQDLSVYDIQSFDPELGRTLLEFQAIVYQKMHLESISVENSMLKPDLCFRNTRIEDLCLDFTLPGYPDYVLSSESNHKAVNLANLEDYIKLVVDATIHTGIARQIEAFRSGFNQAIAIEHLRIFTEEELERLLCGERDFWAFNELLEHIKFDHGYTASSPPITNLLQIIQEFEYAQRRAFLQFVTGAPRLPPGGLASLNPKLTIVRKHSSNCADTELPSVMTCANYLKLPPYSSKVGGGLVVYMKSGWWGSVVVVDIRWLTEELIVIGARGSSMVAQLSYQTTPVSLTRARSIITRLRNERQLHRLDANSLGLLASASAKSGHTLYASSLIKSMLRSGYLPHVKAWSAVVSRLSTESPSESIKLFDSVTRRVRQFADPSIVADSKPDTAAYNAVLNACANLGDKSKFLELFDEMSEWGCKPDVLTYNVMIKLCARADRKDLLVFVLERMIEKGIRSCMTTLHSLVAAYVGFDDLETAEKIVQAMREGRNDLCRILRDANLEDLKRAKENEYYDEEEEDENSYNFSQNEIVDIVFEKLLPNSIEPSSEPPLLPKVYTPNSRIYTTLMKGYMKAGRVSDTVRMLEAMRHQDDKASHPDHVTYTTVVSAFVKAGLMDRAREVLAEMTRIGVPANRITYNILLKGYCQQLQIDKAKELLREMADDAGIKPDVVSYNILIDGCILIDDSAGALAFFNEMRERGIAPTKISYTTLMKAFALSGQPKLANKVFNEMLRDPRVKVDLVAWNMLVEGYCRLGLVEEAKKIIQRMKENGFHPNAATYCSLANGISVARKPGEALLLWQEIKERCEIKKEADNPSDSPSPPLLKPDEGLLDTLADICVRAAFFKKALEIVACMEENGIPPNKTKYKKIYVEMHSRMFTSKHASQARQDRRIERKRAAEAFKFWLGLPNSYYASEWHLDPIDR
ncbi:E3 ubiquitin-protein ligase [Corchorus olitorius]|uniref:HECT-type E3 ubiquitin transferase n=1 Tax=Corchorus olitorius TaxID=93759 RepID=A0A1R3HT55_9ROSI|nr:E3 ubiquitin-protein ligase [Corchorus olitorius]